MAKGRALWHIIVKKQVNFLCIIWGLDTYMFAVFRIMLFMRYYTPGLISLILFPIMCVFLLRERGFFRQQYMLTVFCAPDEAFGPQDPNSAILWNTPKTTNLEFALSGDSKQNKLRLDSAFEVLHKIYNAKNTSNGVHFIFDGLSKYKDFVAVLSRCQQDSIAYMVTPERNITAYYIAPAIASGEIVVDWFCGTGYVSPEGERLKIVQAQHIKFLSFCYELWPVWVLFLLLALLGFRAEIAS